MDLIWVPASCIVVAVLVTVWSFLHKPRLSKADEAEMQRIANLQVWLNHNRPYGQVPMHRAVESEVNEWVAFQVRRRTDAS